jgi:hypothetical protein
MIFISLPCNLVMRNKDICISISFIIFCTSKTLMIYSLIQTKIQCIMLYMIPMLGTNRSLVIWANLAECNRTRSCTANPKKNIIYWKWLLVGAKSLNPILPLIPLSIKNTHRPTEKHVFLWSTGRFWFTLRFPHRNVFRLVFTSSRL